MISPLNSSLGFSAYRPVFNGTNNSEQNKKPTNSNVASQTVPNKKKELTPEQKTWIALGAAATLIAGGLIVKHCYSSKAVNDVKDAFNVVVDRPKEFNKEYVQNYADKLKKEGKLGDEDAVLCIPKQIFDEAMKNASSDIKKIYSKVNLSENGFAMAPARLRNNIFNLESISDLKFVDPQTNVMLAVINELKNGRMVTFFVE